MKTTTKRILQVLLFCLLAAVLSLGTAIATSAAEVQSGATGATEYAIGASGSGYTLVQESGNWYIKNSSNQYLQASYSDWTGYSGTWSSTASQGTAFTVTINNDESSATVCWVFDTRTNGTAYITYSNGLGASKTSTSVALISSGGSTTPDNPQPSTSSNTVTLYFTNNKSWNNVYAYVWKDGGTAEVAWPGKALETHTKNSYEQDIYSVTIDLDQYDRVIFNNGSDSAKTVDVDVNEALNNGSGIYIDESDSDSPFSVKYYNHNIDFSKTIEKLSGDGHGDYDYRLHLNVEGKNLAGSTTEVTPGTTGKNIAFILDVSDTMTSTWGTTNTRKLELVRQLIMGNGDYVSEGVIDDLLKNNNVKIIPVWGGQSGTYEEYYKVLTQSEIDGMSKQKNGWDSLHVSPTWGYTTALMAVDKEFGTDKDVTVVFLAGDGPDSHIWYKPGERDHGTYDRGTYSNTSYQRNIEECKAWSDAHPNSTIIGLGIESQTGHLEHDSADSNSLKTIAEYSGGTYYGATEFADFQKNFNTVIETLIPGDKTKDLTVVDTLSDKVAFLGSNVTAINLTATMRLGSETAESTDVSSYVSVDFENKTVTFSGYGMIDGIFYLEIAFDIKTADDVFRETALYPDNSGYPNTGDEGTDYGSNTTSSNQPGYFSNVKESSTVSYQLNNEPTRTAEFKQPVVQAPEPQDGVYKFTYPDRNETIYYGKDNPGDNGYFAYQMYTKTVTRRLKSAEIRGYSGNGNQAGVPTYLWTEEAQALFDGKNPLVTASFEVQGNEYNYDNVSFYKHDIVWPTMIITELPANQSIKVDGSDVVVTAEAPEKTFTFKYVLEQNGTITEGAENIKYAENVTFNPAYKGQEGIHVIEGVILPENLTYWSSDAQGNNILTTVKTFGMLIRGGYTADDLKNNFVTVYAQTKTPTGDEWKPVIEEATLTRVIADNDVNRFYADYMVDYLNINGVVVQDMLDESKTVSYGLVVLVSDNAEEQEKMQKVAKAMADGNLNAAYVGDDLAYRFEYADKSHISDYNRTLFTLNGSYEKLNGKTLTAIAYIIVPDADTQDKIYYYSPVNTQIYIKKYED